MIDPDSNSVPRDAGKVAGQEARGRTAVRPLGESRQHPAEIGLGIHAEELACAPRLGRTLSLILAVIGLLLVPVCGAERPLSQIIEAHSDLSSGFTRAKTENKVLMIVFGSEDCGDCRALRRHLQENSVRAYFDQHFVLVGLDLARAENRRLVDELGVNLQHGIPTALFFRANGQPLGNTAGGQLEAARRLMPSQILAFLRAVQEEGRVISPQPCPAHHG